MSATAIETTIEIPKSIRHSHEFQQQDLGETLYLFSGEEEALISLGAIYNFDDFPDLEEEECEEIEQAAIAIADKIVRAYNSHDALLAALKEEHGWDDPLHTAAQPDCWKCSAIAKAEAKPKTKGESQ